MKTEFEIYKIIMSEEVVADLSLCISRGIYSYYVKYNNEF